MSAVKEEIVNTVTMTDGRNVDFAGKRQQLKTVLVDREAGTAAVRFDFSNGKTFTLRVPGPAIPNADGLLLECAAHGLSQKVGDESAGADTVEDAAMACEAMIDRLSTGLPSEWRKRNEGGGKAFSGASLLLEAMLRRYPEADKAALGEFVKGLSRKERDAMTRHAAMEPFVKQILAERDKKQGVNADALDSKLAAFVQPSSADVEG